MKTANLYCFLFNAQKEKEMAVFRFISFNFSDLVHSSAVHFVNSFMSIVHLPLLSIGMVRILLFIREILRDMIILWRMLSIISAKSQSEVSIHCKYYLHRPRLINKRPQSLSISKAISITSIERDFNIAVESYYRTHIVPANNISLLCFLRIT